MIYLRRIKTDFCHLRALDLLFPLQCYLFYEYFGLTILAGMRHNNHSIQSLPRGHYFENALPKERILPNEYMPRQNLLRTRMDMILPEVSSFLLPPFSTRKSYFF